MRIVAAAIKLDGFIAIAERPNRHHNILHNLGNTGFPTPIGGVQGFITDDGQFIERKPTMLVAIDANQLIPREGQYGPGSDLFSEDLW